MFWGLTKFGKLWLLSAPLELGPWLALNEKLGPQKASVSTLQVTTTHGKGPGRGALWRLCHPRLQPQRLHHGGKLSCQLVARLWLFIFINEMCA